MLGTLQPGQSTTKQIVVKGLKPFKILEIRCDNDAFTFQPVDEEKTVQQNVATVKASSTKGKAKRK